MTNEPLQQAIAQLKKAPNILIVLGSANPDAIAAALALREFLVKLEKLVTILSQSSVPARLNFLPEAQAVKLGLTLVKNLVIDISTAKNQINELRYQKFDDKLSIFLTAKNGEFDQSDVKIKPDIYPFNLVVTIGLSSLDELGSFYAQHAQLFFETPVVNIDFRASNEAYGQVNLINLTAAANSEVVYDLLNEYDANFIDEKIATLLLAGLIAQTNSFQSIKTSPQAFLKASRLISAGARQQDIISQLYRNKSLGLLRLWGRVLARVKQNKASGLVYSLVNFKDVEKSEASASDVEEIITEMVQQLPFAKTFLFLAEADTVTTAYAATTTQLDLSNYFAKYQPQPASENAIKFTIPKNVLEAEAEIIAPLEAELAKFSS
jgi:nanoRNase/pAp phosphatase (c-di-AMP/oligoRNAs hydrolase)